MHVLEGFRTTVLGRAHVGVGHPEGRGEGGWLRVHMPIAIGHGHIGIAPEAAPGLAMEGRAVSAKLDSDLR